MTSFPILTDEQQQALYKVQDLLREVFPPLDTLAEEDRMAARALRKRMIEKKIAPLLLGRPQKWSEKLGYQLGMGPIFTAGAFCVYWGRDEETGQIEALLHYRKDKKKGAVGGYVKREERSYEGVKREGLEELRDHENHPVFEPDGAKYRLIVADHEFDTHSSVHYTGYAYKLSDEEMARLKAHIKLCSMNPEYNSAAVTATHGETTGLEFVPFTAIKDNKQFPSEHFTYWPHYKAYHKVVRLFEEEKEKTGLDFPDIGTPIYRLESSLPRGARNHG